MTKARFESLNALVWVTDVPAAIRFYTGKLGFTEEFTCDNDEGEADFAVVERDGIQFHLQKCVCDDGRHTGNTFVEVVVDDVANIAAEYDAAGGEFVRCVTEEDWGTSCKITDPDGNWILFTKYND